MNPKKILMIHPKTLTAKRTQVLLDVDNMSIHRIMTHVQSLR